MEELTTIWPSNDVPSSAISIYDGPAVFLRDFRSVDSVRQTIFAAYWLQAEVLNGGLRQFFANDTGVLAPESVEACRTLGLPVLAEKIEEAMAWFGSSYPRKRELRQAALDAYVQNSVEDDDPFALLDDDVAALLYDEGPGVEQAAVEYVKKHGN